MTNGQSQIFSHLVIKLAVLIVVFSFSGGWAEDEDPVYQWDDHKPDMDLEPAGTDLFIKGGKLSLRFGINGQLKSLETGGTVIDCVGPTIYRLDKERASVTRIEKKGNGVEISLTADGTEGLVSFEGGDHITVRFDSYTNHVTFGFGLPSSTRFHQMEGPNITRILDRQKLKDGAVQTPGGGVPWGDWTYQILVAELDGGFMSIAGRSDYKETFLGYRAYISRCRAREEDLAFEFTWRPEFPIVLSWHDTLEDAAAKYRRWMEEFFNLKPIKDQLGLEWLDDLKLIVMLDMGRPNGEVAHSYQHGIDLAKELYEAGAKGGILFYLTSWWGMFDGDYPDYTPKDWLGGEEKFEELIHVFHDCGYRVMLHFLPWGGDPFLPGFREIKHMVARGKDQEYPPVQWTACYPTKKFDYDSGRQRIIAQQKGKEVRFTTVSVPRIVEGRVTLGGIRLDSGAVTLSVNARSLPSPEGKFAAGDPWTFPYTFLLYEGENEITLQFPKDETTDLSEAWYRIHDTIYGDLVHTHPIVAMDMGNDEWVELFTNRVIDIVRKYKIDAVHLDASTVWDFEDEDLKIDRLLFRELPGVVFSSEKPSEPSMIMYQLTQNGIVPTAVGDQLRMEGMFDLQAHVGEAPVEEGGVEFSPLASLIFQPYRNVYLHLVAAEGFVPVARMFNCVPGSQKYTAEELDVNRRVFQLSPEFGLVRSIRLNYRDYGLDEETKEKVLSLY